MIITYTIIIISMMSALFSPVETQNTKTNYFNWNNATVYFLLTDRFNNGDSSNDINFYRTEETSPLRGFRGGDIRGVIQKIEEGYFQKLGVDVIWFSPIMEQIHGFVNEGQGNTYAYHGYWTRDWSSMEPNFGTEADLKELMEIAHKNNIRIMLDVIINHTGPVTDKDPVWPNDWVRTEPQCSYQNSKTTIECTLVENLPDILTEKTNPVELPADLLKKWQEEGRLEKELAELEEFFAKTNYPKTPRYYIIKWLTDFIREFGIDGFRVDTVKHTEADVWDDLAKEAGNAFAEWKANNHEAIQEEQNFFMLGEVYNYNMLSGPVFDFGDKKVNYFENGFQSLINFGFKGDANRNYEDLFSAYSEQLNNDNFKGITIMNYISSHDDSYPFDANRERTFESATKLLLTPGMSQIYYGDEVARPLKIEGAQGDANLRGMMTWDDNEKQDLFKHWQKLGQFRQRHPSIGAGIHIEISKEPYTFVRTYVKGKKQDRVFIGLDLPKAAFTINLKGYFADGEILVDRYSNEYYTVDNGNLTIRTKAGIVLLERTIR
jgi:alpha-amylase